MINLLIYSLEIPFENFKERKRSMKSGKLGSQQMIHLDLHETIALTTLPLNEMLTLNKVD